MIEISTESTFEFNRKFFKQMDDCIIREPLSVTVSDIYMAKTENNVVILAKPIFYWRFIHEIYSKKN